ncbi:MAG: asparagine--tRNA ligase [Spirochaetota bacterium]
MLNNEFRIVDAPSCVGEEVELDGWVRHIRSSGSIFFMEIRDGTGEIQVVVVKAEVPPQVFDECSRIKIETSVRITGKLREENRAPGGYEITASDMEVIHVPEEDYPISKKSHGVDFLLENRHLWIRSRRQLNILRVRSELVRCLRNYFHRQGFVLIDTPILTGSVGEDAGNLFSTSYFDLGEAYLAQTGQLYLEAAAAAFKKVFCLGPTFRAEKSKTRRHLTEFWMLEAEVAFCDSSMNMDLQEDMISKVLSDVLQCCERELKQLGRDTAILEKISPPFVRISYTEALDLLEKKGFELEWGEDIGGDEETALSESFEKPVFIYNYPSQAKAFYMKPNPRQSEVVLCDDLFAPEGYGEIIGGSQRDDEHNSLYSRIEEFGLDPGNYRWYLELRKYGSVPHSGFGLGVERMLAWICGLRHVREAIPFPRLINRLSP